MFGGYLVLNTHGRPLEFHCTAPVKPNRAQEILYGPTLRSFLYAEQIGQTLLLKAKVAPLVVCTNVEPMLEVREFASVPVVLIATDRSAALPSSLLRFQLGSQAAAVRTADGDDRDELLKLWPKLNTVVDLTEPFTRIREAIEEARKVA